MFCLALFLVVATEVLEKYYFKDIGSWFLRIIPLQLSEYLTKNIPILVIHKDSYYSLLSTVAGMSGVFLGLYFTALSVVAQSMFRDVPDVIRDLLVKEKIGNIYVRTLALLASISIVLLGYMSMGFNPGIFSSIIIVIISCYGVLSFVFLGTRVFYFFDLAKLTPSIFEDLNRSVHLATIKGYGWYDPAFQTSYRNNVLYNLESIKSIAKWCNANVEKESQPLKYLAKSVLVFILGYQKERRRIPSNSKWFVQNPRYENWFFVDESRITIALQTQTDIQPEFVPKWNWVEDELITIFNEALSSLISSKRLSDVYELLQYGGEAIEKLGSMLDIINTDKLADLFYSNTSAFLDKIDPQIANSLVKEENIELALLDQVGYICLQSVMSTIRTIITESTENMIQQKVKRINWSDRRSIYTGSFPAAMHSQLEFVYDRINFELRVEDCQISPHWYINQLVLMKYADLCKDAIKLTSDIISKKFVELCQRFKDSQHYIYAAQHASRGLELCEKIFYHLSSLKKANDELSKNHILKDLEWPHWDLDVLENKLKDARIDLIIIIAECMPFLAFSERCEEVPDYFGRAYNTIYKEAHSVLQNNNTEEFKKIISPLFISALKAYDNLQNERRLQSQEPRTKMGYLTQPLVDLLELSGYVKIYSEYHQNPQLWQECAQLWDEYFLKSPNAENAIKYFVTIDEIRHSMPLLFSRDILRTNFEIQFKNILRKSGLIKDYYSHEFYNDDSKEVNHASPFIRALCHARYEPFISSVEIFLLTYLKARPEAANIKFNDRCDFLRYLEEENKKNSQSIGS